MVGASSSVEVRLDPDEPDRQTIPWGLWMNNLTLEFLVEIVRGDLWTFFGLLVHTPTSSLSLEPCPTFMPIESPSTRSHTPAIPPCSRGNAQTEIHIMFQLQNHIVFVAGCFLRLIISQISATNGLAPVRYTHPDHPLLHQGNVETVIKQEPSYLRTMNWNV
jgi:hypothetical protein